jgi:hypothetical protein
VFLPLDYFPLVELEDFDRRRGVLSKGWLGENDISYYVNRFYD